MAYQEISTSNSKHQVLEEKLTSLGLYLTAQEAYELWKADPEKSKVLDVRTFEEYVLIGHAEMAANVPLAFPSYKWDANKGNYSVVVNKDFIAQVKARLNRMIRSWSCAALVGAALWRSMHLPRLVSPRCTTSSMVLKAIRLKTPKASIMECECETVGRTQRRGPINLIHN